MKLTKTDLLTLAGTPIKTCGHYNLYGEDNRNTNYCKCGVGKDWSKPCPACGRRVKV